MSDTLRQSVVLELTALGLLTLLFVVTFSVRPPYVDFALAGAAVALIVMSTRRSRRLWALAPVPTAPGARAAWQLAAGFTALALVVLAGASVIVAHVAGEPWLPRFLNWHFALAVPVYLLWALLQQYIFQFYLLGRLLQVVARKFAIPIAACAFAVVHFPRWPVMLAVLIAGSFWSICYFRSRRLLPLAVSHALLGAALHYWVLGHDLLDAWLPH